MVARSETELVLFNQLDREMQWPDEQGMPSFITSHGHLPRLVREMPVRPLQPPGNMSWCAQSVGTGLGCTVEAEDCRKTDRGLLVTSYPCCAVQACPQSLSIPDICNLPSRLGRPV